MMVAVLYAGWFTGRVESPSGDLEWIPGPGRTSLAANAVDSGNEGVREMVWPLFVLLGLVAGGVSGLVGIGGGIIIVPALVMLFGFSQKLAQGTTLALLVPPIGILAAYAYYQNGLVDVRAAALIVVGFVAGSFLGARYVAHLSNATVTRIFAVFLIVVAVRMLITVKG
jgi:uncharacterized membrane protein YfcA